MHRGHLLGELRSARGQRPKNAGGSAGPFSGAQENAWMKKGGEGRGGKSCPAGEDA